MNPQADLNERMSLFRLASRELFNQFFRVSDPYNCGQVAWQQEERFCDVQIELFKKMVAEPLCLNVVEYGYPQPRVLVEPREEGIIPIMLNREVDSGYWDYPVQEIGADARLLFIGFFDWDQLDCRDNRYVRVQVDSWSTHPDVAGKHGLIEWQHVRFSNVA